MGQSIETKIHRFVEISVDEPPKLVDGDDENIIAFVPGQGFQSCRYSNGSKTWQSLITYKTVTPTIWLRRLKI